MKRVETGEDGRRQRERPTDRRRTESGEEKTERKRLLKRRV